LAKPLISQWDGYSNGARIDDNVEYLDDDTKLVSENGAITHWSGVLVDLSAAARRRWPVWSWLISRRLRRAEKLR
jgi:hypothetical protein